VRFNRFEEGKSLLFAQHGRPAGGTSCPQRIAGYLLSLATYHTRTMFRIREIDYLVLRVVDLDSMTANIVPVWSMTKRNVISGAVGSSPMTFSAIMTWAELDTGNNSQAPWIVARIRICRIVMGYAFVGGRI
jgi:hypothetical protein